MRKSNAETAETRKRILAIASGLFLKNGIAATGISDVMSAAGLTQGGFYRHFSSKEHLVADANAVAFDFIVANLDEATRGLGEGAALPWDEQLRPKPACFAIRKALAGK